MFNVVFCHPNVWSYRRALCSAGLPLWKLRQSLESKSNLLHVPDGTVTGKTRTIFSRNGHDILKKLLNAVF